MTFNQSTHREFEQSQGRERNTTTVITVPGFRRRSVLGFYGGEYCSPTSSSTPAAPSGVGLSLLDINTSPDVAPILQIVPADYPGLLCDHSTASLASGSSQIFGTPTTFSGAQWTVGTKFKCSFRVWGVAMLCNPWVAPIDASQFGETIYDANQRYILRLGNNPAVGTAHGIEFAVNAIAPNQNTGSGDPKGLWRFDRMITAYGTVTNVNETGWEVITPALLEGTLFSNALFRTANFPFVNIRRRYHEPNPTLTNPAPPFSLGLIPSDQRERASHLFDYRDRPFSTSDQQSGIEWASNGIGIYLIGYSQVPALLPIEYVDSVMEQVSQVRS